MLKNTPTTYGTVTKSLHWLIAFLIIGLLAVGLYMTDLPDEDFKWTLYGAHKAIGVIVLALVCFRFLWRSVNIVPDLPLTLPTWQKKASRGVHYCLYFFMLVMPLSGYLMSVFGGYPVSMFGIFVLPAMAEGANPIAKIGSFFHHQLPYIFIAFIIIHTLAALYHHFVLKDNVFKRML